MKTSALEPVRATLHAAAAVPNLYLMQRTGSDQDGLLARAAGDPWPTS